MIVLRVAAFGVALVVVIATLLSAVRTFVVPRGTPVLLTRWVFLVSRFLFVTASRRTNTYEERDRIMAVYAPLTLVILPMVWLMIILGASMAMFWSLGTHSWTEAFRESGSSMLTLGFEAPSDLPSTAVAFAEAVGGLGLLALLLAYLPTIYTAFSRREASVAMMEVRAGSPPTPEELLRRAWVIGWTQRMGPELWQAWQLWFIDIEETHTSYPSLTFFRSPQPERSWITAAACVLDTASIVMSSLDLPREAEAALCVRTGTLSLRRIADYFSIEYDPDPAPTDPIVVSRDEYEGVVEKLRQAGLPIKPDREQAWRDFAGWRVNYDRVLIALAGMVLAPPAPWSSDRSAPWRRPPLTRRGVRDRGQVGR